MKNLNTNKSMGDNYYKTPSTLTQQFADNFTQLFLNGWAIDTIANDFGFRKTSVFKMIAKNIRNYKSSRSKGSHLNFKDRRFIEFMRRIKATNTEIAQILNCSVSTVANELKRGQDKDCHYCAMEAQIDYLAKKPDRHGSAEFSRAFGFLKAWVKAYKSAKKESPFSFWVRYQKEGLFSPQEMVHWRSIYNYIHAGLLEISPEEMPFMAKRKKPEFKPALKKGKHTRGHSIDERPLLLDHSGQTAFGHWEIDCVCGSKDKTEPVILSLLEKRTRYYALFKIPSQSQEAVHKALKDFMDSFGRYSGEVFKTITADNGTEFLGLYKLKKLKNKVYYCHPAKPKERAQNERHNGILRTYIPKGIPISGYSEEQVAFYQETINGMFRKVLNSECANSLFEAELDKIMSR